MRILVADDNAECQQLARKCIQDLDHECVSVEDGLAAVEAMKSGEKFDYVLMDLDMPRMGGIEAAETIRREKGDEGSLPAIIAVTANSSPDYRTACRDVGMVGFIAKPLRLESLRSALNGEWETEEKPVESGRGLRIDYEHFDGLMAGGDPQAVAIFEGFCNSARTFVEDLERHRGSGDEREFAGLAHQLKGSFATFGLPALAEEMGRLEELGNDDRLDDLDPSWAGPIQREFDELAIELRSRF